MSAAVVVHLSDHNRVMVAQVGYYTPPLSLLNYSALALFAQRTRILTSARSIGFYAIWVCISSTSSLVQYITQICYKGPGPVYIKIARLLTLPDSLQDRPSPHPESTTKDQRRDELDVDHMDIRQRDITQISILKNKKWSK